ncbi:MAG: fasciclin domain-containing protein [Actinomycetota bacterium]|nr:fasciclin domain-containing protein [Actinomycetota bacterium]
MAEMDIVDTAVAAGDFTVLAEALQAAGLVDALKAEGPFTVFAPTDEAFAAALEALGMTKEELFADTELLTAVLTYHVVSGAVLAADVVGLDGQSATTLNGAGIEIAVVDGGVVLNGDTNVVTTDIIASNGVIHVIDKVLLPPSA